MSVQILIGDCRERMKELPDASVDSVVCDPPYHLTSIVKRFANASAEREQFAATNKTNAYKSLSRGFMGQTWDGGDVAFDPATWVEVLRVLKPGGHMIAFSGTRTYHRMVCAIEDAGFEIRDQLAWVYATGFPKSLDVSKAIDKAAGANRRIIGPNKWNGVKGQKGRDGDMVQAGYISHGGVQTMDTAPATESAKQWQGWGTALKPSWEPICLARRPLIGSVAANVLAHGTGALNIDGCRIEGTPRATHRENGNKVGNRSGATSYAIGEGHEYAPAAARWPANLCHDGSDEVLAGFPAEAGGGGQSRGKRNERLSDDGWGMRQGAASYAGESGSAARFFYTAKATSSERGEGNNHPTVKPVALMRWLCRLVTPKGGTILDPFMGSGSTGLAADAEQFNFIGCELSAEYAEIARKRIADQAGMFADIEVVHSVDARAA